MALSESCQDRLLNFKFEQAISHLDVGALKEERNLIYALATMFGDPGWFDGSMSTIIWAALDSIGVRWRTSND